MEKSEKRGVASRCEITFQIGDRTEKMTDEDLRSYAAEIGLERLANGRYCWTFVLDILLRERCYGIEPRTIVEEVRRLESGTDGTRTKGATQFEREPLRGLWHKHYFCARFVANNIQNALRGGTFEAIFNQTVAEGLAKGEDEEIATKLAHRLTHGVLEQREEGGQLTGEWIVFANHERQNYYLCLAEHRTGDEAIFRVIKGTCFPQFPFLERRNS